MGLQLMMAGKSLGAKVIISDVLNERLDLARQLGADMTIDAKQNDLKKRLMYFTNEKGVNAVVTSVGQPTAITQALDVVRKRGRVVIFGGAPKGTMVQLDPNILHYNEVAIVGTEWIGVGGFLDVKMCHVALDMIRSGRIPVEKLVSHKYPLERIHEAIELVESMGATKCLITVP
jgi:L-iditol 2-dehydrogenase